MRRAFLFFLAASLLSAQFEEFAVTDDGRLFFTTVLNTRATEAPGNIGYKVYRYTGDGLSLHATGVGDEGTLGPNAIAPLVSGDGSVSGYAMNYPCRTGSCGITGLPRTFFMIEGTGISGFPANSVQVSRDARFLLVYTHDLRLHLLELPSLRTTDLGQFLRPAGRQALANSGAVLFHGFDSSSPLQLAVPGESPRTISGTEGATSAALSPDAVRIAYEIPSEEGFDLVLSSEPFTFRRTLASAPRRLVLQPSFANDGTLLYLAPGSDGRAQPYLATLSGETVPLATIPEGATNAILSGNGQLAWVSTANGRLLRIRTADGVADEMIPATPFLRQNSYFAYPGSVIRLIDTGLTPAMHYKLGDADLPFSETTPEGAAVQIPWETLPSSRSRILSVSSPDSPFTQSASFGMPDIYTITFERDSTSEILQAAHQDFRGLITPSDAARPGETIHVFARNMGPVDLPVATGQPSPVDPPARVLAPIACYLLPVISRDQLGPAVGVAVPFAGLAGGAIGIYQIDVTIPADWSTPLAELQCRTDYRGDIHRIAIATSPSP